jgi:hypothetical protein
MLIILNLLEKRGTKKGDLMSQLYFLLVSMYEGKYSDLSKTKQTTSYFILKINQKITS